MIKLLLDGGVRGDWPFGNAYSHGGAESSQVASLVDRMLALANDELNQGAMITPEEVERLIAAVAHALEVLR